MSKLREAAEAVVAAWDSASTSETFRAMRNLRRALRENALNEMQALTDTEYQKLALACLSETHQQLGAELGETDEGVWYEYIGTIDGTYGGRWTLAAFAENWSTAWPDNTAVYVRRVSPPKIGEQLGEQEPTLNQNTSTMWEMLNLTEEWQARLEAAVLAEREACAKVAEDYFSEGHCDIAVAEIAAEIRARGQE